ncbi:unnamed protein product [Ostreobium quekettii]|uniref:Uncharacterized protein n=1 Tax=Ostreobium quekettii TaxID=121088 RepID=A0A8S1JCY8_9CHLO|nr:unnamed protein product [Ostreobium quekettii]
MHESPLDEVAYQASGARMPGAMVIGAVGRAISGRVSELKARLRPERQGSPAQSSKIGTKITALWERWHGPLTLCFLLGTLVNMMTKVYMDARYDDICRCAHRPGSQFYENMLGHKVEDFLMMPKPWDPSGIQIFSYTIDLTNTAHCMSMSFL